MNTNQQTTGYPQQIPPPYFQPTAPSTNASSQPYPEQADLPYAPQPSNQYLFQPPPVQYAGQARGLYRFQETQQYPDIPPPKYGEQPMAVYPEQLPPQYPTNQAGLPKDNYSSYPQSNYPPQIPTNDNASFIPPSDSLQNIAEDANWTGFSEKAIRNAFIRKVYAILMLQLAFTVGVVCLFIFEKRVNYFVKNSLGTYLAAYVLFLSVYIALACCSSLRRKHPTNIILLTIFTIALTYLVATLSCFHDTKIVLMALGICTACCLAISVFSCFTKFDFTSCAGVLFVFWLVVIIFGIIAIFTYKTYPIMRTVYAGLGALLFMLFLAFDTQMVMGGKKYQLSPEEYVFAALQLYLDIVYIFIFILALLGGGKK